MSRGQYAALPDSLTLREVRVRVEQKGFRTREVIVVTTLLDAEKYSAAAIATLYRRRWQAEISHPNYRSSKPLYLSRIAA
jgi:IS4 transposase